MICGYKPYVLLVDDDEIVLSALTRMLQEHYEIKTATNGRDALFLAQEGQMPDLILLDVGLPDFNGFDVCAALKNCSMTKDIPVIFITGNSDPAMEFQGLHEGAIDYISKPFSPLVAKKRIEQHLAIVGYQRSLELFKALYESTSEGIIITDSESVIQSVNPAFTDITGYLPQEIVGKTTDVLSSKKNTLDFYQQLWKQLNENGKWSGEIWSKIKNGEDQAHSLNINTIYDARGNAIRRIGLFSDITAKKQAEEIMWRHANFDALTNLPNRRFFYEKLESAIKSAKRKNSLVALFFLDLDHFKEVNDTMGHSAGDKLLIQTAERIKKCVREIDVVARLGGDEFTIIFEDIKSLSSLDKIAQDICNALSKPFQIKGKEVTVSTSIGIAVYPTDTDCEDGLLKKADQAMYQSKSKGRNCFSRCSFALH